MSSLASFHEWLQSSTEFTHMRHPVGKMRTVLSTFAMTEVFMDSSPLVSLEEAWRIIVIDCFWAHSTSQASFNKVNRPQTHHKSRAGH